MTVDLSQLKLRDVVQFRAGGSHQIVRKPRKFSHNRVSICGVIYENNGTAITADDEPQSPFDVIAVVPYREPRRVDEFVGMWWNRGFSVGLANAEAVLRHCPDANAFFRVIKIEGKPPTIEEISIDDLMGDRL